MKDPLKIRKEKSNILSTTYPMKSPTKCNIRVLLPSFHTLKKILPSLGKLFLNYHQSAYFIARVKNFEATKP